MSNMNEVMPEDYLYLASPYSHEDASIRSHRFSAISKLGFDLIRKGLNLFCPITQSHTLNDHRYLIGADRTGLYDAMSIYRAEAGKLNNISPLGHDECMRVDYSFLKHAKGLIVAMLDGWKESQGVALEIAFARANNLPIYFLSPNGDLEDFVGSIKGSKGNNDSAAVGLPKGASKKGKPSIMNFPWKAYRYEDGIIFYMIDVIEAMEKPSELRKVLYHMFCQLIAGGTNHMDINEVFLQGQEKHGLRTHFNYGKSDIPDLVEALGRHIVKDKYIEYDSESNLKHKSHIGANILMLMQILNKGDSHE